MKIYISYTTIGYSIEESKDRLIFASEVIRTKGHIPICIWPLDMSTGMETSHELLVGRNIDMLLECDAVVFLDGWERSKECNIVFHGALIYGKQIFYNPELTRFALFKDPAGARGPNGADFMNSFLET